MLDVVRGRRGPRPLALVLRVLTVLGVLLLGLPLPTAYAVVQAPLVSGPYADASGATALASTSTDTTPVWFVDDADDADIRYCWIGQGSHPALAAGMAGWSECEVGAGNIATFTAPALADGAWTFVAVEHDGAAGFGPVHAETYTVDTTGPVATVTAPASPSPVESVDWQVSLDTAGTTTCTLARTAPTSTAPAPVTCAPGTVTTSLAGEPEGTYELSVVGKDALDNTGAAATATYVLDRLPGPAVVVATPEVGTSDTAVFTVSPPAPGPDGAATLSCELTGGPSPVVPDCTTSPVSVPVGPVDGDYVLTVTTTDGSGSSRTATATYSRDTTAPTVDFTQSPSGSGQAGTLEWRWDVDDLHPIAAGSCSLYLGSTLLSTGSCTSPYTATVSGQGSYSLRVTASDAAGNDSAETASPTSYLRDTVVPVVSTTSDSPTPTRVAAVTFGATVDDPDAVLQCRLERTAPTAGLVYDWSTCPTTAVTLTEGSYLFSARATDDGQTGTASRTHVVDLTAPAPVVITRSWTTPTNDAGLDWALSAPAAGDTRTCRFTQDGGTPTSYAPCSTTVGFPLGATSGLWLLEVRDVDLAGNERVTAADVVELDLVAPARPVLTSQPSGSSSEPSVTWGFGFPTGTPADTTTFECRLTGPSPADGFDWKTCATPFAQVLPTDGSYVLDLRARDDAGNPSALPITTSATYVLDRVAPGRPSVGGPSGTSNDTTVEWTFSPAPADSATDDVVRAVCYRYYEGAIVETIDPCVPPVARTLADDGLHRLDVVLVDAAANPSPVGSSSSYLLDTAAPLAPTVAALTGPAPSSTPTIQWAWSTSESLLSPARVECRLLRDGLVLGDDFGPPPPAPAADPCATPRTDSGLTDGSYVLQVRVVDAAGNVGAVGATAPYVIDTGAPAVPTFPGAPTGASTSTSISWTISAESGTDLSCRLVADGDRSGAFLPCASPYSATGLADASYELEAFATDDALNAGGVGTSPARVVDTTGPVLAAVSGPVDKGKVARVEWTWVAPEPATTAECQLRQDGVVYDAWRTCTTPHVVTLPTGDETTYYLEVRLTDAIGNTGPPRSSPTYLLKTTLPMAPTVTTQASPSNDTTPTWTFSTQAGTTAECRLDRTAGGPTTTGTWVSCGTPYSRDLSDPATGGGDASYALSVRLSDDFGNTGPATTSSAYVLDTAAPAAPALVLTPTGPSQDDTPTWTWTGEAGATGRCSLNGGAVADCTSPFTPTLPSDGTWVLSVALRDAAGNTSGGTAAPAYVLDRVAPPAPVAVAVETSPIRVRSASWTLPAVASGDSRTCRLTLDGGLVTTYASCGTSLGPVTLGADGAYRVEAVDTDAALNASATGTSLPLVLDTVVPGAPTITAGPSGASPQNVVSWSFTVPSDASAQCRLERDTTVVEDWAGCASPLDRALTTDGTHVLVVRSADAAGNLSSEVRSASYLLDRVAPSAPSVSGPSGDASTRGVRWTWTAETGASVTCVLRRDGAIVETLASCASPVDRTLAVDGTWRLDAVASDAAGNVGPAGSSADYRLDTVLPVAPTVTGATGPTSSTTATWGVTAEAGTLECRLRRDGALVTDWAGPCATPVVRTLSGDGGYVLDARVVDAAGNVGAIGSSPVLVHDTFAPAVPVVSGRSGPQPSATTTWDITADAGTTQECRLLLGGVAQEGFAPCGLSVTRTLPSDGAWQLEVVSYDAARNPSVAGASAVYALDTLAPLAPVVTGPTGTASTQEVSYGFAVPAGHTASCVLRRDGVDVVTVAACTSPLPRTLGADGTYVLAVRLTDAAGNTGPEGLSPSYVLDTAAPGTPVVTGPTGPSQSRTPTWTITGEAVTATCRVLRGAVVVLDSGCLGSLTADLTAEPDGSYVLEVVTRDLAGNASAPGTSAAYVLDTTAPPAPVVTGPAGPSPDAAPVFSWTGESGTTATCAYSLGGAAPASPPVSCTSPTTAALTSDGAWALRVQLTDAAGNTSLVGTSGAYLLDTLAPTAPVVTPPAPTGRDRFPTWGVTAESGTTLECRVTGQTLVRDWQACTAPVDVDLRDLALPDGPYVLSVRATDLAGLTGPAGSGTYVLDTVAPAAPVVTVAATGRSLTPSFSFTSEAGTTATCRLSDGDVVVQTVPGCTSPVPVDLTGLGDGPYNLNVRVTDAAGNTGLAGLATYVLDTTAPSTPVFTARPASPSPERLPVWSFRVDAGATPVCRLVFPTGAVRDITSCASPLPVNLEGLPDGDYTLQVRAVDAVGNSSAAATTVHELSATALAAPVVTPPASPSADGRPTWRFTTPAGAVAECRLERPGATTEAVFSPCLSTTTYTATLFGEPDGSYRLSVRARYSATAVSAAGVASYVYDTTAPAAPVVVGPPSPSTVSEPVFTVSTVEPVATAECRLLLNDVVRVDWAPCAVSTAGAQNRVALFGDATYRYEVRLTDAAGNTGVTGSAVYVLSTQAAPAVSVKSPPSPSADASPEWEISVPAGSTLECRVTGPLGDVFPLAACTSPFTVNLPADGAYVLTVHAVTAAGAIGPDTTVGYTLDTVVPATPTNLQGPTSGKDRGPVFTFSLPTGTTGRCTVTSLATSATTVVDCASPFTMDLGAASDGRYSLTVVAVSGTGVPSLPTTAVTYELVTTVAAAPVFTLVPGSPSSTKDPVWHFTYSTAGGAQAECRLQSGVRVIEDYTPCVDGTKTVQLGDEPDGTYSLLVRVTNPAGDGPAIRSDYVFDRSAVALPLVTPPASPDNTTQPQWLLAVPATAPAGTALRCAVTTGATPAASAYVDCTPTYAPTITSEGLNVLWVLLLEPTGRVGSPVQSSYVLDTTAPAPPVVSSVPADRSNQTSVSWSWLSATEAGLVSECLLHRNGTPVAGYPIACSAPFATDLSSLGDGSYRLDVRNYDVAGNAGAPGSQTYVLDRVAPRITVVRAPATASGTGLTPSWSFTMSEAVVGTCSTRREAVTVEERACNTVSTTYAMDLAGEQPGDYSLWVKGKDPAGNTYEYEVGRYELIATQSRVDVPPTAPRPLPPFVPPPTPRDPGVPDSPTSPTGGEDPAAAPGTPIPGVDGLPTPSPFTPGDDGSRPASPTADLERPAGGNGVFAPDLQVPQAIADAVSDTFKKPQLPLALLFVVVLFLLVQNRIDRRDPKLAGAPVGADDDLTFGPAFRPGGAPA